MRTFKPTFNFVAYRIHAVEIEDHTDEFFIFRVTATPIRDPAKKIALKFVTDLGGRGRRFGSLAAALGVKLALDIDKFPGRVFAMKGTGGKPDDFASLEYASACLQSDHAAFAAASAYAGLCAAEEKLGIAA
jgi:hypothetical protein